MLEKLHKSSISITDIASQYWCERQMELNYRYGKRINNSIRQGRALHEELEEEVNVPIILQPKSYADALYKNVYTSYMALLALGSNKKTREVQVYGSANGYKLVGKVDMLEIKGSTLEIVEDKTRGNDNVPSSAQQLTHKVQVMLYRKLIVDMQQGSYSYKNFESAYKAEKLAVTEEFKRQLDALGVKSGLASIDAVAKAYFKEMTALPEAGDVLTIRYINQFTGKEIKAYKFKYDEAEMAGTLQYAMKYWNGEREAMPVPKEESWKCRFCAFYGKECKVWWPQKVL
ncbi:MAG: exonuclease V [Candidatus Marsarchaeota archaeon]|jgi:exonuclease V|nr:exonuclease V [Candidatus Marsarchaeota archaeon]MCL5418417.1 exonuclease V [Candidatus Marsarchaeota archaeon]